MTFKAKVAVSKDCGQALVDVGLDARKLIQEVSFGEREIVLTEELERKGDMPEDCLKETGE